MFRRPDSVDAPLYVVTTVFNPVRYRSRWKLYDDFAKRVAEAGAILYTAEIAYGERAFVLTEPGNPRHLQLRTGSEVWLKENALNLMIQRLPLDWKYVAWIDADVAFMRDDWGNETLHQLQHHPVVQMWSEALDLNPLHETMTRFRSFAWCYHELGEDDPGLVLAPGYYAAGARNGGGHVHWHPGFAWAARREAIDGLGGLIDWAVLGSADHFMARALIGQAEAPRGHGITCARWLQQWQDRAERHVRRDLGIVEGSLVHYWHGPKAARRYRERQDILIEAGFEAERDLKRDWQGLWNLTERSAQLRDGIRRYFRERNEDA